MTDTKNPLYRIHGLVRDSPNWPDIPKKIQKEGAIDFYVANAESIYDAPAFFNPVMVLNRDTAILFAKLYSEMFDLKMRVFEPLAGIGIRALRMAYEIPDVVEEIVIADYNPVSTAIANYNKHRYKLGQKVYQFKREARSLSLDLAEKRLKYHFVDLDPFGSPAPFIDSVWEPLHRNAIVALTATDMTALCGVYPLAGLRKYGGLPLNNHHCHETAARLLIGLAVRSAARFERGVEPVFSISVDHYTRVFFKITSGRGEANNATSQIGFSYTCKNCHEIYYVEYHKAGQVSCCGELDQAGPLWIGQLFDSDWCQQAEALLSVLNLPSEKRLRRLLQEGIDAENLKGYYVMSEISKHLGTSQPAFDAFFEEIRTRGYTITRSWFTKQAFRTDASGKVVREVILKLVENQHAN